MKLQSSRRITFITGQLGLGGAEKQLFLLVRGLAAKGWQARVISLNAGEGDHWEAPLAAIGVPVVGIPRAPSKVRRLLSIRRELARGSPQIVHSWTFHANLYAAMAGRLARVPVKLGSERANHLSSRADLGDFWYGWNLHGLDGLVANSTPAADYLRLYRPKLRVDVVLNGVEIPEPINLQTRQECRRRLGLPQGRTIIGAVGSMVPRKNFPAVIKAVSSLNGTSGNPFLVLIGDGPSKAEFESEASNVLGDERFRFTGALPDAQHYYPAFDILCSAAQDKEGIPNVIMEASAAGLPVVATAVGGVPKIVEHGVTGLLVKEQDGSSLARELERLASNPELRRTMGAAGREKVKREFSVDAMVDQMTKVYEDILLNKGVR